MAPLVYNHDIGPERARRYELRRERSGGAFSVLRVRSGEVYQVLRVDDHGREPNLPDAVGEGFGIRAGRGDGPALRVGDKDLDRLQALLPRQSQGLLQPS